MLIAPKYFGSIEGRLNQQRQRKDLVAKYEFSLNIE
jgi:hypothetical protein